MHEVTIKIRAFPYYPEEEDPITGETRRVEKVARRGDTIELSDTDFARAQKFDAIKTEADVEAEVQSEEAEVSEVEAGEFVIETASVEQLAEWLQGKHTDGDKPIVEEVVAEGTGDPELAQRLLDAENLATGQQPRRGVEDGLKGIIEDAGTGSGS